MTFLSVQRLLCKILGDERTAALTVKLFWMKGKVMVKAQQLISQICLEAQRSGAGMSHKS